MQKVIKTLKKYEAGLALGSSFIDIDSQELKYSVTPFKPTFTAN